MARSEKFTSGPWRVGPINYADVYGADGQLVALAPKGFPTTGANAQLIAAAPDLLEACQAIDEAWAEGFGGPDDSRAQARFTDRTLRQWRHIRAAIAKALGERPSSGGKPNE